jgi:hypothetical protein
VTNKETPSGSPDVIFVSLGRVSEIIKSPEISMSLPFTLSRNNISNDQQRIYEKGFNEFSLEKSECAEQQTNYY